MLNCDLIKIESWANRKIIFNPKKAESLLYSRKMVGDLSTIFLGNAPIPRADNNSPYFPKLHRKDNFNVILLGYKSDNQEYKEINKKLKYF